MKNTKSIAKVLIFTLLVAVVVAIAVLPVSTDEGFALNNSDFTQDTSTISQYKTQEEGSTVKFYVSKHLYESYSLTISYQRVKLANVSESVTQANGVATNVEDKYILDAQGTVAINGKSDLILNTSASSDDKKYYFQLTTYDNCAWIFTIEYVLYAGGDAQTEYKVFQCANIDYQAPEIRRVQGIIMGDNNGFLVTIHVYDNLNLSSAWSGIKELRLYKGDESEPYKTIEGIGKEQSTVQEVGTDVPYYVVAEDNVGNTTQKIPFADYTSEVYNQNVENKAKNIVNTENYASYASSVRRNFESAYATYFEVTRNADSTESEKQTALSELSKAIEEFNSITEKFTSGKNVSVVVETIDVESTPELSIIGIENAMSYLKIGDEVTVTLSSSHYNSHKDMADEKLISASSDDIKSIDEMYTVTIITVSQEEKEIRKEFDATVELRFYVGECQRVSATHVYYTSSVTDEPVYTRCTAVQHTDGTVSISVPYTSGTVKIFVVRDEDNLYWLFSLTAIPLLVGGALLIYSFRKINKIKQQAQTNDETAKNDNKTQATKQKPPTNKKKKKKKK